MGHLSSFVWLIVSTFVFLTYLVVMFQVVVDLFRDPEVSGFGKAMWIIGLIFLPIITALIYVISHGGRMAERQRAAMRQAKAEDDALVTRSASDQIAKAKSLLDAGAISRDEFLTLKGRALA
jgi:phospholipase D-like protein